MARYRLTCFGPPILSSDGKTVKLKRKKSRALLVYLAVTGKPHTRDSLSALLWPNQDASHSLAYLRMALSDINSAGDEKLVEAERETVSISSGIDLELDVTRFRRAAAAHRRAAGASGDEAGPGAEILESLVEAAGLYAADFLSGFSLRDAAGFDEWQFFAEEELRQEYRLVLQELIAHHSRMGEYDPAVKLAKRLLKTDELNEADHRLLMRLYALSGEANAAMRQYRSLCRLLEDELEERPDTETVELYERIRAMRSVRPDETSRLDKVLVEAAEAGRVRTEAAPGGRARPTGEPTGPPRSKIGKIGGLARRPAFLLPVTAVLAFLAAFTVVYVWVLDRGGGDEIPTLAVLPLRSNVEKPEDLWFAEGMTDALITELAMTQTIRVKSHTTMSRYRNVSLTVPEIARELDSDYILDGMVVRFDDGVRVSIQLIDGKTDEHVFSRMYESDSSRIRELQVEFAQEVAQRIYERLDPEVADRMDKVGVLVNPQCEVGGLLGRYHMGLDLSGEEEEQIFALIEKEIGQDPYICDEYLRQADMFWNTAFFGNMPPAGAEILAQGAVDRMLEIDPTSARAYMVMGILELIYGHDAARAERCLGDALERGPGKPEIHRWYAALKVVTGDFESALEHLDRAEVFDPYHRMNSILRASVLYFVGRHDEAVVEARRYIDDAGENRLPHLIQGWCLIQMGRFEEAEASLRRSRELKGGDEPLAYLGYLYGRTGRRKEAWGVLSELSLSAPGEYPSHVLRAIVYAGLGEDGEVMTELEQAVERKEPYLLWKLRDPVLRDVLPDTHGLRLARLQTPR